MNKVLQKIIQFLCTHKYVCTYVYNISADWRCDNISADWRCVKCVSADWRCVKCGKRKKGIAPIGLRKTEMDYNNHYFKNIFNK